MVVAPISVCQGGLRHVRLRAFPNRVVGRSFAVLGVALAVAVAIGALELPNVADAASKATASLGGWTYLAVVAFVFLETTVLLGFLIHGELVLMIGGLAAAQGDGSLVAMIALAWAAAVAGDMVSLLLGRRLGRPFLERRDGRVRLGTSQLARVDGFFERHGGKALFPGRFTGFLRSTMPFAVGSAGVTMRRVLPFSAASGFLWTSTFTLIGYTVAGSFAGAGQTATRVGSAGSASTAVALQALRDRRRDSAPAGLLSAAPAIGGPAATKRRHAPGRAGAVIEPYVNPWREPRETARRGGPATGDRRAASARPAP
jgi:membrane-associated protein